MRDVDAEIREALRSVDALPVPVQPLDPAEIATRARRRAGTRWTVIAAVLVLVVGSGVWAATRSVSGMPSGPSTSVSAVPTPPRDPGSVAPGQTVKAVPATVGGAMGVWVLAEPGEVTAASTSIAIVVERLSCSGGITGTVLTPAYELTDTAVILRTDLAPLPEGVYTCQGNGGVLITVVLPEPIGNRALVDWACLREPASSTRFCFDHGVRRP